MPFARKKAYKKRNPVNKPWYKKKYNAMELASKAAAGVWYLKGLVNSEKKFHNLEITSTSFDSGGTIVPLTSIAQGDTELTRDGISVFVRSLQLRGVILMDTASPSVTVRCMIVIDKSTNPGTPVAADVLQTISSAQAPFSPINNDNKTRFQVLYSTLATLSDTNNNALPIKFYRELRHHVKYNGATATAHAKGQLLLVLVSDHADTVSEPVFRAFLA